MVANILLGSAVTEMKGNLIIGGHIEIYLCIYTSLTHNCFFVFTLVLFGWVLLNALGINSNLSIWKGISI